MEKYTVGNLVAECLEQNGVHTVFGIISVHNIPIMDGIALRPAIRMVMTRGETGAAHMADGFGRASGELGAVISSTGPGARRTPCARGDVTSAMSCLIASKTTASCSSYFFSIASIFRPSRRPEP